MNNECFFTAGSGSCVLDMHFFDRGESGQIYLNIKIDYGGQRQAIIVESMGYWILLEELQRLRIQLSSFESEISLKDILGDEVFKLQRADGVTKLTHAAIAESTSGRAFSLSFIISEDFVRNFQEGLGEFFGD